MSAIRTILHPTDFSSRSENAFRLAALQAKDHGARLVLLHVVEPPRPTWAVGRIVPPASEECRNRAWDQLLQLWPADPTVGVQHLLAEGDPAAEILRTAQDHACDLIVMGTHGRSGLDRLLLGSVAEAVLRNAVCPVLTVKVPIAMGPAAVVPPSAPDSRVSAVSAT